MKKGFRVSLSFSSLLKALINDKYQAWGFQSNALTTEFVHAFTLFKVPDVILWKPFVFEIVSLLNDFFTSGIGCW